MTVESFERFHAIVSGNNPVTALLEEADSNSPVDGIIFGEENAQRARRSFIGAGLAERGGTGGAALERFPIR
jgi:hypothetical protein